MSADAAFHFAVSSLVGLAVDGILFLRKGTFALVSIAFHVQERSNDSTAQFEEVPCSIVSTEEWNPVWILDIVLGPSAVTWIISRFAWSSTSCSISGFKDGA